MKLSVLVFFLFISTAFSQPVIPELKMWATDLTGTLDQSDLSTLNSRLKSYEDTTSNQIVVLMIPSLDGYPIEMLSEEIATRTKIGTDKNDNGILLLIAKNDRQLRIEVGYGLEGVVPDAIASSIIRNEITPEFKNDDYFAGIDNGITALIKAIGGEYKADSKKGIDLGVPFVIFIIIIIIFWIIMSRGGPFVPGGVYRTGTHSGGWTSSSSGWGGSSWSGGGGFSGGGGSFGGGGASGSW